MVWSWYIIAAALVLAAGCSFFFALAESALFALGRFRARQLLEENPPVGQRVAPLFEQPEDLVATLTLGNTVANAAIIGLTVWILTHTFLPQFTTALAALVLILVGCEIIPKALGVRAPDFWAARLAPAAAIAVSATKPLRRIAQVVNDGILRLVLPKSIPTLPLISDEEYQDLLNIAQQQGAVGKAEKDIILQILSLDTKTASDVMNARSTITCISDDLSREEMIAAAREARHTRIPLYDESPDTIVGVLNARALLLNPELELEEVIEFPSFVPESMNLLQLLRSLQRQQRGLAIVLDEFGGTAGLVTMEDILEETLGRFRRKDRSHAMLERVAPGRWRVSGPCTIDDFRTEYPALADQSDVDTMGGLLVRQMEYVPSAGESTTFQGLKLTARRVDERRVLEMDVEALKR
jgi:CBS domain containing-hemolysin-like protein